MRVAAVNGSPKGEQSVSLQYLRFIEKHFSEHAFTVLNVGQQIRAPQKDLKTRLVNAVFLTLPRIPAFRWKLR
jgi:hypothetical protein